MQCRPSEQGEEEPQEQSPSAQPSLRIASQLTQGSPLVPQWSTLGARHDRPEQQPSGHDPAPQAPVQIPSTQPSIPQS
jgi:hypothetical protein